MLFFFLWPSKSSSTGRFQESHRDDFEPQLALLGQRIRLGPEVVAENAVGVEEYREQRSLGAHREPRSRQHRLREFPTGHGFRYYAMPFGRLLGEILSLRVEHWTRDQHGTVLAIDTPGDAFGASAICWSNDQTRQAIGSGKGGQDRRAPRAQFVHQRTVVRRCCGGIRLGMGRTQQVDRPDSCGQNPHSHKTRPAKPQRHLLRHRQHAAYPPIQ